MEADERYKHATSRLPVAHLINTGAERERERERACSRAHACVCVCV